MKREPPSKEELANREAKKSVVAKAKAKVKPKAKAKAKPKE